MKNVALIRTFIAVSFMLSSCNILNPTISDLLNKNEKIIFGNSNGTFELKQNTLIPEKFNTTINFQSFNYGEFSPDGKKIIFSITENNTTNVYIMNSDGSNKIKVEGLSSEAIFPRWSGDSKKIVFTSNSVLGSIYIINSDASNLTKLTNDNFNYINPTLSPDGTKIAFSSNKDSKGETESLNNNKFYLYVMNSDGTNLKRLINDEKMFGSPNDWLGNEQILYNNGTNLFTIKADGSNLTQITKNTTVKTGIPGAYYELARVSSDKKKIVFSSNRDGNREIYLKKIDDDKEIRLTNNNIEDFFPKWFNY